MIVFVVGLLAILTTFAPVDAFWAGGSIAGSRYGAIGAGGGTGSASLTRVGSISSVYPATRMASLPSGMVNVNGEIVDTTNKIIQKVTGVGGTQYYSYLNQKTGPIFQTPTVDTGKHFILFQDVNYPPGDGHYIVLKRWRGMPLGGTTTLGGALYEAYYLDLGDSINALVSNWNMASYTPMGVNGLKYGAYGGGMGLFGRRTNVRMTRGTEKASGELPPPPPPGNEQPQAIPDPSTDPAPEAPEDKPAEQEEAMVPVPNEEVAESENDVNIEEEATETTTTTEPKETVTVGDTVTEPAAVGGDGGDQVVSEEKTDLLKKPRLVFNAN